MKVLIINGSPRKKTTYQFLEVIKKMLLLKNFEVELISLQDYEIKSCRGCEVCIKKGSCVLKDDMDLLKQKMIESDGIIIGSPVYMRQISGGLKNFIDRTCSWFHRPELVGKSFLAVSTTAGSALKSTLNYLEEVAMQWGMIFSGGIGRKITTIKENPTDKEINLFLKNMTDGYEKHRPSRKIIFSFQVQKVLSQKLFPIDKIFWDKNGWLDQMYYYPCKVGLVNRFLAFLLYQILMHSVNPENEIL